MKSRLTRRDPLRLFPCSVCSEPRDVRMTKKGKPYIICNPCGMQMFIRVEDGIRQFDALVEDAERNNVWNRLAELRQRYELTCPKCGKKFWMTPELIRTSWVNGKWEGYRCPEGCEGIVKPEKAA